MAGSIVVGILKALLVSDTAQYDAGMNRAAATAKAKSREINSSFASISKSAAGFAKTFAGAFGVTITAGAVIGFTKQLFDLASTISDVSAKTGLSVEAIQRMQFVADQTGTSLEAMTDASFKLSARLAGGSTSVRAAAKDLGLEWDTLRRQSPEDQFNTIASALGRLTDAGERNRIGIELFGKSFSSIASSVAQDYAKIADAATVASKAQIDALDRAGDRLAAFVTNVKAAAVGMLGNVLLMEDALREVEAEDKKAGVRRSEGLRLVEAERRVTMGLVGARTSDIQLTIETVQAKETYAQKLKAVRAELAALSAADRAEIAAAQQLGVTNADLEDQYHLTAGALAILTASQKTNTTATKEAAKVAAEAAKRAAEADGVRQKALQDLTGAVEAHIAAVGKRIDVEQESLALFTQAAQLEQLPTIDEQLTPNAMLEDGADTTVGRWGDLGTSMGKAIGENLQKAVANIPDLFVRAFTGGGGFTGAFKALGIQMADAIVKPMIEAMLKRIAAARLGQAVAGAFGLGGAVGGGGGAAGAAASVAAAGGSAASGAGGVGGVGAAAGGIGLGTTLAITGGVAGAALLAWAIWKKGLFRGGEESLKVSPRRDKFLGQFGGPGSGEGSGFRRLADRIFALTGSDRLVQAMAGAQHEQQFTAAQAAIVAALGKGGIRARSFATGGFVPPGAVVPAMLHGGLHGEDITPRTSAGGGASIVINIQASAIDANGMDQVFQKAIIPRMKAALTFNQGGLLSVTQRSVR